MITGEQPRLLYVHAGHGRTNLYWWPHVAHKTFSRQIQTTYRIRTFTKKAYHTRTITKKAYRTSFPYFFVKIKEYGTVPTYRTVLPSLVSSDKYQEPNDNNDSSEDKAPKAITAGNAMYYNNNPFTSRLFSSIITIPFPTILFHWPEIIVQIVRETNRKATDVRHECKLLPKFVFKSFIS